MKKKVLGVVLTAVLAAGTLTGCGAKKAENTENAASTATTEAAVAATTATTEETAPKEEDGFDGVTIVYTNDIHAYLANDKQSDPNDKDSERVPALRLSTISQMVKDLEAEGKEVLLVDDGDEIQGNVYGSIDEGESVVKLMSAAGYDVASVGNHDFDYGVDRLLQLADMADYPFLSCNFHSLENADKDPFESYRIFDVNGKKIAFIGITTPETLTTSTPVYFQDKNGNYIYKFDGTEDPQDLYDMVQKKIDEVRGEADFVIALGHTGVEEINVEEGISSYNVIENTTGLDAYIDGHSHTVMEGEKVKDKEGKEVLLTQAGCYLNNIGQMTISADGEITTRLFTDYEGQDPEIAAMEEELYKKVDAEMGEKIAVLDDTLYVNNPDNDDERLIRAMEMNLGDFVSDSVYWFLNEDKGLDCDVVLSNGGGIRAQVEAGPLTYLDVKKVNPFGNMICLVHATGQEIKDALEMGTTVIGEYDPLWNAPTENGGFMQVAGLRYTIDGAVPTSVKTDGGGMFVSVDGEYRVKDVEIYDRESGEYVPLDPDKDYLVGGIAYILRNGGNGLSMFMDNDMVVDYLGEDWEILADYVKSFKEEDGEPHVNTQNSPLTSYKNYQLDYEDPYGAGRITIKNVNY